MEYSILNMAAEILVAIYVASVLTSLIMIGGMMSGMKRLAYQTYGRQAMKDLEIDRRVRKDARKYETIIYLICLVPILNMKNLSDFIARYDTIESAYLKSCGELILMDLTIFLGDHHVIMKVIPSAEKSENPGKKFQNVVIKEDGKP